MLRFKELGGVQKFSCQTETVATSIRTTSAYSPSAVPCFFCMSRTSSVANSFITALQPTAVVAWCFRNKLQPENQANLHSFIWVSDEWMQQKSHGFLPRHTFYSLNTIHFFWKQHRQYSEPFVSLYVKVKIIKKISQYATLNVVMLIFQ